MAEIYLAGGCFWGMQKYLESIPGVKETTAGYANGRTKNPTYEQVCGGSGHAETVRVVYDPGALPLGFLLSLYFDAIDPTSVNRQGNDRGEQYRTGIYYTGGADLPVIRRAVGALEKRLGKPVAVEVKPLADFTRAEESHQRYLDKNPGGYCHIPGWKIARASRAVVDPTAYRPPDAETLRRLTPAQRAVTRSAATEPPLSSPLNAENRPGIYVDVTTGEPLFLSADKFDAGCGWPSFTKPIDPNALRSREDLSHGMVRTEVRSRVGDAHLGHVFEDGPEDRGGLRYCINGAALRFVPRDEMAREGYGSLLPLVR